MAVINLDPKASCRRFRIFTLLCRIIIYSKTWPYSDDQNKYAPQLEDYTIMYYYSMLQNLAQCGLELECGLWFLKSNSSCGRLWSALPALSRDQPAPPCKCSTYQVDFLSMLDVLPQRRNFAAWLWHWGRYCTPTPPARSPSFLIAYAKAYAFSERRLRDSQKVRLCIGFKKLGERAWRRGCAVRLCIP